MNKRAAIAACLLLTGLGVASCSHADPKAYADAYCKCLVENDDPNAQDEKIREDCKTKVDSEVGKLLKDSIPAFQDHMRNSECAGSLPPAE